MKNSTIFAILLAVVNAAPAPSKVPTQDLETLQKRDTGILYLSNCEDRSTFKPDFDFPEMFV